MNLTITGLERNSEDFQNKNAFEELIKEFEKEVFQIARNEHFIKIVVAKNKKEVQKN